MGVTGLWTILHPCARPIKLETLNRKRLAVDASIWIYQFLKAVRDKEGNALRNSHVVGFFRRICKLLFFGIQPVFVFDGGAPALKRQTVSDRKRRREGRREDAVRTAGRLLAVQMQRRAEEEAEEARRREKEGGRGGAGGEEEEEVVPDEGLVYVDEINMMAQERQQNRKFRKKDAYHLPDLEVSVSEMGGINDPRVMSLEELQAYARQFETGEDINVYDFSKIDYDSPFFMSLPASDRYNILNAARLRSRLRMGHSKEQLDNMFPDRMAFSRFQIERVRERNELTQRLMHINEGGDTLFDVGGRVAGEKGREYVLVRNDGVEGGWALGVISDEGTKQETAIDLDAPAPVIKQEEDEENNEEEEFEDVPIEGLNRLPKRRRLSSAGDDSFAAQRKAFYKSRKPTKRRAANPQTDANSLFVTEDQDEIDGEVVDENDELFGSDNSEAVAEDEELRRAIAMSLEQPHDEAGSPVQDRENSDDDMLEIFQQSAVPEARAVPKGSGRAIANIVNKRAFKAAPESREITSFGVPALRPDSENDVDEADAVDLQAALAESRKNKRKTTPPLRAHNPAAPLSKTVDPASEIAKQAGFSGPLPFESLNLGSSLLGKKKMQERSEEVAGGFENAEITDKKETKKAEPLPPWFSGDVEEDLERQRRLENQDREQNKEFNRQFRFQSRQETLRRNDTNEVIDLDLEEDQEPASQQVIDLEAKNVHHGPEDGYLRISENQSGEASNPLDSTVLFDPKIRMGDIADKTRVEPPAGDEPDHQMPSSTSKNSLGPFHDDLSEDESPHSKIANPLSQAPQVAYPEHAPCKEDLGPDDESIEWSESENGESQTNNGIHSEDREPVSDAVSKDPSSSPSAEFEDVDIPDKPALPTRQYSPVSQEQQNTDNVVPASGLAQQEFLDEDVEQVEFDDFSDPEDEELLNALALEAEEHARFASTLNNKTQAQNVADYERELKQLRNQQKKDRRDADEVTHIMIQECQQLLRLFGLPYVTAPMEAEAQCAKLVQLGLVDGIVTDDSDCFLFGGTRIYKNMFNQAKFVECYLTSDLEKEFDLTREKLISVAHLLGSDYTEGLPGVGPVTALEILTEFPTLDDFKTWWTGVQMNEIPKSEDAVKPFRKKFRKNATKLFLPPTFPDSRVDVAYMDPEVDDDPQPFQWGVPDLESLRSFLMATIGWSQERTDEVLVPVIKDMNRRADEGTQSNLTAYFEGGIGIGTAGAGGSGSGVAGEAFAPRKKVQQSSKRMGTALDKMAEKARANRTGITVPSVAVAGDNDESSATANTDEPNHGKKKRATLTRKRETKNRSSERSHG